MGAGAEVELIDLKHLGRAKVIGAWRVGEVIVDPGPSSCLGELEAVLERHPPRALALTHIHLDHAGATGSLVARFPDVEVWVHERGARHLTDPSRLLASATRLYGADMERLWGEVLPVPAERLRVLRGGERLGAFALRTRPATPRTTSPTCTSRAGARSPATSRAFASRRPRARADAAAGHRPGGVARVAGADRAWRPLSLAPTHFGSYDDVAGHLQALREQLERRWSWRAPATRARSRRRFART